MNQQKVPPMSNNQDAVKLLPCPWCGPVGAVAVSPNFSKCGAGKPTWVASCQNCQAKIYDELSTQEIAAQRWNNRTPTPREQELEAQLNRTQSLYSIADKQRELALDKVGELEAQNKALWELVETLEPLIQYACETFNDYRFNDRHFMGPKYSAGRVSIQKAKEAR